MVLKETLETSRLVLRKLKIEDAEEMFSTWCNDSEVTKYMTWNPHQNIEETRAILKHWIEEYDDPKTVRFGITIKDNGKLIGSIDVVDFIDGNPEIGYCIGKAYWNNGYMTEACKAMINYLLSLGYKKIIIRAHKNNIGSNRVIQKCGLKFISQSEEVVSSIKPIKALINYYEYEA